MYEIEILFYFQYEHYCLYQILFISKYINCSFNFKLYCFRDFYIVTKFSTAE